MRSLLLLISILVTGCSQSNLSVWIAVGEDYQSVRAKLVSEQAESLQGRVGILSPSGRMVFYELRDGACLELTLHTPEDGTESIAGMTLGEAGLGYGDKSAWMQQQKTTFDCYDLARSLRGSVMRAAID